MIFQAGGRQSIFLLGFFLITVTDFFITVCRISAAKIFPYGRMGSLNATINLVLSVCMMVVTIPAGFMAQSYGTNYAYAYSAFTSLLGVFAYTYAIWRGKKRAEARARMDGSSCR